MDDRNEISAFLMSRRARLTPQQAGLPDFGGRRRVVGLRREEVALLAGMSTEYYTRLERGNATGVSATILEGISRALQLDAAEHLHLHDLVRNGNIGVTAERRSATSRYKPVRPAVQQMIDAMASIPVVVGNRRLDVIAVNNLGHALFSDQFEMPGRPINSARYFFLDPKARDFFQDWASGARQTVAVLRAEAGRAPYDRALTDLIGELSTRSEPFRSLWATHDVREHTTGMKRMHHPVVGDLELNYESMDLLSDPGLRLVAYTATPATPSHDALKLLSSWAAAPAHRDPVGRSMPIEQEGRDQLGY